MVSRRSFVRGLAIASGIVLSPLSQLFKSISRVQAQNCSHGDLYAGFLLLDAGDPLPSCVTLPTVPIPNVCGAGDDDDDSGMAKPTSYQSIQDMANSATFNVYKLSPTPTGLDLGELMIIYDPNDGEYMGLVSYEANQQTDPISCIRITTEVDVSSPYPLWPDIADVNDTHTGLTWQQVSFLPTAGVFSESQAGFISHWIEDGILYTLIDNHSTTSTQAAALASTLTIVT